MAKLIVALILAFLALATAHTTTILTTIEDDYPLSRQQECSPRLQRQNLNQCRMYIMRGDQQVAQQCCQQLENVEEQCQCEAVKQVFRDAVQQVHQQQGQQQQIRRPFSSPSQQIQRFQTRAQQLKNQCNIPRQCSIGSVTTTMGPNPFRGRPFGSGEEECSQTQIQRPVSQCRRYVEEQMYSSSPRTLLAQSFDREGQQECCRALKNLNRNCQCEAIENVAWKVMRELPQQGGHQSGQFGGEQQQGGWGGDQEGQFGGKQEQVGRRGSQQGQFGGHQQQGGQDREMMEMARRLIQNLPDQCSLEVQQCNIPF